MFGIEVAAGYETGDDALCPEAMQHCISQRMQMVAEDGRRLSEDYQKVMQKNQTMPSAYLSTRAALLRR